MFGAPKRVGGIDVRFGKIWLQTQEHPKRGPRFQAGRCVPKRGNQPMMRADIFWLSTDRISCSSNRTVDAEGSAPSR